MSEKPNTRAASVDPIGMRIEWEMIDRDLLIDDETLQAEFDGDLVTYLNWCLSPEGADLSILDIVSDDHRPRIVAAKESA